MEEIIINIDSRKNIYEATINGRKIEFSEVFNITVRPKFYQSERSYIPLSDCEGGKKISAYSTPTEYELTMDIGTTIVDHFLDGRKLN